MTELREKFFDQPDALRALSRTRTYKKSTGFHSAAFFFSGHILIENHEKGASCYHYDSNDLLKVAKLIDSGKLSMNSDLAPVSTDENVRWKHNSGWQKKFEIKLRAFGIFQK